MQTRTYHVDSDAGDDANDGLDVRHPRRSHDGIPVEPGDRVLFRRGSVFRRPLHGRDGSPGSPVTYGAYGSGAAPAFLGSVAVGDPADWVEVGPDLWRCAVRLPSEVCNLVFADGSCGTMRWQRDELVAPGDWHDTGMGRSSAAESGRAHAGECMLLVRSPGNPATRFGGIEAVLWGGRRLLSGRRHIVFEDLDVSQAGVHGYQEVGAADVTIRGCRFSRIGGAVWDGAARIRFGNAIEFWDGASDILIEDCVFDDIYDSGVTHQGGGTTHVPCRLRFRRNRFERCGMAAYECREPSRDVDFADNICLGAGCGFSMQGVVPPRQSEIHPLPMGHHVFIWRIDPGTQDGTVRICGNEFHDAPYGSAIFSIIDPADERRMTIDRNRYRLSPGAGLARLGGRDWTVAEFAAFRQATGFEQAGSVEPPAGQAGGVAALSDRRAS